MREVSVSEPAQRKKRLIESDAYYVMVSHMELDSLIASIMHVVELDSDKEHRDALKGELKSRARQWLDQEYEAVGYKWHRIEEETEIISIQKDKPAAYTWIESEQN